MLSARLRLSLRHIEPDQWRLFERLSTKFLSSEFGQLRELANSSGDEGRDATLFQPSDDETIAAQYSVATDWQSKIRKTARTLVDKHPEVQVLIYMSPQEIGPGADKLKSELRRKYRLYLDVRDRNWFEATHAKSPASREATEDFVRLTGDAYLEREGILEPTGLPLSTHEARAALLYLVLQREDDNRDRHLTKLCFDALVRAALRETDNEHRMKRADVHKRVQQLLPTHNELTVQEYTERALQRLYKRAVRHWPKDDTFCLSHEERSRLAERMAMLQELDDQFADELQQHAAFIAEGLSLDVSVSERSDLELRLRRVLQRFLFERGEAFVHSVSSGDALTFVAEEVVDAVKQDVIHHPDESNLGHEVIRLVAATIERSLLRPSPAVQTYLRALSDGYTLFAFLRETPNVQSAVTKLFAHGRIWLDTSVLLPLMGEELLERDERVYQPLFLAAREAGAQLYVTDGVLEELTSHLEICLKASSLGARWRSRTPFILACYLWSGRPVSEFARWVELFRGRVRPMDDVREYLEEEQGVTLQRLDAEVGAADPELRAHALEFWYEVHSARRPEEVDDQVIRALAAHDLESHLGVLERRRGEKADSAFGYSSWWLTLDRRAFQASAQISSRLGIAPLPSPVLSIDFLSHYLSVGPARRQLDKSRGRSLPLITDTSLLDAPPIALIEAAEAARDSVLGQDDRVVRRKIRDHLELEKLRRGKVGSAGFELIEKDIREALMAAGPVDRHS